MHRCNPLEFLSQLDNNLSSQMDINLNSKLEKKIEIDFLTQLTGDIVI